MKKQIFILVFLVVATFASVSKSYGQAVAPTVVAPRPLTLVDSPLAPIVGKPYTYSATINPATGNAFWYATTATTFMTAGARPGTNVIAASATSVIPDAAPAIGNYATLTPTAADGTTSTKFTWASTLLNGKNATTAPLFVVVEYNGPVCTTSNNVKVMQIIPQNAFTIDLTNMTNAGPVALPYGTPESQCYKGIVSSSWVSGTGLTNNYGTQVLYFELVAANFSVGFKPTFQLSGLKKSQTATIDWGGVIGAYPTSASSTVAVVPPLDPATFTSPQQTVTTTLTNTTGGAAIYIRVTINNNGYEGVTAGGDAITLAVDAVDNSGNNDVTPAGIDKGAFAELAVQTLNARPAITPGAGMTFVTQVP